MNNIVNNASESLDKTSKSIGYWISKFISQFGDTMQVCAAEINRFLDKFGIEFRLDVRLMTIGFCVIVFCIYMLLTLFNDRRTRSIVLVFVSLAIITLVSVFIFGCWLKLNQ